MRLRDLAVIMNAIKEGKEEEKMKKGLALFFMAAALLLTGCGSPKEAPAMGRYIENEVTLPEGKITGINSLLKTPEGLELYTYESGGICFYTSADGKSWEKKETPGWLKLDENQELNFVRYGEDGCYYAAVTEYQEKESKQSILCSEDGKTAKKLTLPVLEEAVSEEKNYTVYNTFCNLQVLENGTLAAAKLYGEEVILYARTGEELGTTAIADKEPGSTVSNYYTVQGNTLIGPKKGGNELLFYDGAAGKELRSVEYPFHGSCRLDVLSDGEVILADTKGIHRLEPEGTLWQTLADGELNSFGMPSMYLAEFLALENEEEDYLAAFSQNLYFYSYDAKMPAEPQQELTVYSLRENATMRQAIAMFQRKNGNVKVNYIVGMEDEAGNINDSIRSFNARLMDGEGVDIIVVDDLPYRSYRDKGVLADLSKVVDTKTLLPGVVEGAREDGKLYALPLRVKLPLVIGKETAVENSRNLEDIFSYMAEKSNKNYIRMALKYHLLDFFLGMKEKELFSEDGSLDEAATREFLEKLVAFYEKSGADESEPEEFKGKMNQTARPMVYSNTASMVNGAAEVSLKTLDGFWQLYEIESLKKTIKGLYWEPWGDALFAAGYVGMNENAVHRELAEEFMQFLFSKEPQMQELYDGFPVNMDALSALAQKDSDSGISWGGSEMDEDGNLVMLEGEYPEEKTRQEAADKIKAASQICGQRDTLYNLMFEEITPLLDKERSIEETVADLSNKLNTYLQETGI